MRIGTFLSTVALGSLLVAPMARAADSGDSGRVTKFENTIQVNPLGLAFGDINADWEHKFSPSHSLDVAVDFLTYSSGYVKTTGFGLAVGYKMYFHPDAFDGWYWEPSVGFFSLSEKVDFFGETGSASGFDFTPGAVVGREWVWEGGFLIDLALGIKYHVASLKTTVGGISYDAGISGVLPTLKFALGYAF